MKLAFALLATAILGAQIRPVPPPGVPVSAADRAELEAGLRALHTGTDPDIRIFHEAVRYALRYNEFFKPEEVEKAKDLLRRGQERAAELAQGRRPWIATPG